MVSAQTLALFVAASAVLVLIPGPNHIYIVTRAAAEGRRAGLASALGVETGTLVHILVAAAGLSILVARSAVAFNVVRYAGAAYLLYLGIRTLCDRGAGRSSSAQGSPGLRRVYFEGVLVNVLNPKVILFFLAFLPQFVDPAVGAVSTQIVVLGLVLLAMGLASGLGYAIAAASVGRLMRIRRGDRPLRPISGVVYIGLGLTTALAAPGHRR